MQLKKLILKNFKGVESFAITTNDSHRIEVFGGNATGKTTIYDAWLWLLFGKDSLGNANFDIKRIDEFCEPAHKLEHTVECVLEVNGAKLTLKKVYSEKWTKKRGSRKSEFTGNTTDYYIDDVPAKQKEYAAKIAELCPEELFRTLSNPRHFPEIIHWTDRRKMLIEMAGDISDDDVIASNPDLADLRGILGNHTAEQYKKIVRKKLPEINREIEKIPTRIDEVLHGLPIEPPHSLNEIEKRLGELYTNRQAILDIISEIKTSGNAHEIRKEIVFLEADRDRRQLKLDANARSHKLRQEDALDDMKAKVGKATRSATEKDYEIGRLNNTQAERQKEIRRVEKELESLRDAWNNQNKRVFEGESVCPTCGQTLPDDQIEAARAKHNTAKATILKDINEQGKRMAATLQDLKERFAVGEAEIRVHNQELEILKAEKAEAEKTLSDFKPEQLTFKDDEILEINRKITSLNEKLASIAPADTSKQDEELEKLSSEIAKTELELADRKAIDRANSRVAELESEEKALAAQYEKYEGHLYLIDQFVRTKVRMLEDSINYLFRLARFRLFKENINGGMEECCDVVVNGVPWQSLNNASRINAGLDICDVMSGNHGVTVPIFVDNAESVTDILETRAQQIRLVVSAVDETLRVVCETETKKSE